MPSGINLRSHCGAVWGDNLVTKTEKDSDITTELVRISLYRILSNKRFEASPRIKRLLTFIVEAKLTGRSPVIVNVVVASMVKSYSGLCSE